MLNISKIKRWKILKFNQKKHNKWVQNLIKLNSTSQQDNCNKAATRWKSSSWCEIKFSRKTMTLTTTIKIIQPKVNFPRCFFSSSLFVEFSISVKFNFHSLPSIFIHHPLVLIFTYLLSCSIAYLLFCFFSFFFFVIKLEKFFFL